MTEQERRAMLISEVERLRNQSDFSRQMLPSFMLGAKPGGAALPAAPTGPAQVIPFPARPFSDQRRADIMFADQMPRLNAIAADRFRTAEVPKIQPAQGAVMPLTSVRPDTAQTASLRSMLGQESLRFGADTKFLGPEGFQHSSGGYTAPSRGVSKEFATPEEAKRAALINAINYYNQMSNKPDFSFIGKAVKPQISEFASPESARQSWRLFGPTE